MNTKTRNSNYELMRIISMFLIVLYHVIFHGKVKENCTSLGVKEIFTFIEMLTIVHVNSFVLVSGYFQSTSTWKQSKLWKLIIPIIFYSILILVLVLAFGVVPFDKNGIIKELFPLELIWGSYWFMKYYIALYCLSPFINQGIKNFSKQQFQRLLVILTLLFSILPFLTGQKAFDNTGYSLYQFIYLYLIGAYLRKYPIENSYLGRKFSNSFLQIIFIGTAFLSLLANYILAKASFSLLGVNATLDYFAMNIYKAREWYSNPFILIQSISYFCFFKTLNINSKIINKLGSLTIGIYLIHDNHFIRDYLYYWTKINRENIGSYQFILYVIGIAILIYIVSSIIEWIRQLIFHFIGNRKISKKIRNKYYDWIHSIYIIKNSGGNSV